MKRLFLLRHAETVSSHGEGDRNRLLTPKGEDDARALGTYMAQKDYRPGIVLCSPAMRTRQTWDEIQGALGQSGAIEYHNLIYTASVWGDLLALIRDVSEPHSSLLLIGHNPVIHQLAFRLSAPGIFADKLSLSYPPATLSVLNCPRAAWNDLKPGENTVAEVKETE